MGQREIINVHAKEKIQKLAFVEKTAKITSDGKHLVIRVPKLIEEALKMEKGERITFKAEKNKLVILFRGN